MESNHISQITLLWTLYVSRWCSFYWLKMSSTSSRNIRKATFDIILRSLVVNLYISHKERWLYLNWKRNADSQPLYIVSSVKRKQISTTVFDESVIIINSVSYSATSKTYHFNRNSQNDNKGATWWFHLIKEVNYLTFCFARSFFIIHSRHK